MAYDGRTLNHTLDKNGPVGGHLRWSGSQQRRQSEVKEGRMSFRQR